MATHEVRACQCSISLISPIYREARHPNVVLYLGLSRAPSSQKIYIISEYIPNGNLRTYIFNKSLPLPWRLRISFATDISRALAYLHARNCIHRDLKGENLLITSNGRLKITDFGFARIAARDEMEKKRLTFCGTDSYMSPEILVGQEFGLPTDIFSLGIIFCELLARKLADDHTFKRTPPYYEIDEAEVRLLASPGTPEDFIKLTLQCCSTNQADRPTVLQILERLRAIELDVLNRGDEEETFHVGSVKLFTGVGTKGREKRPRIGPRIPNFDVGVGTDVGGRKEGEKRRNPNKGSDGSGGDSTPEETSEDEELMEAIEGMKIDPEADDDGPSRVTAKPRSPDTGAEKEREKKLKDANDSLPLHHARQEAHTNDPSSTNDSFIDHNTVIDHANDKVPESSLSQEPLLQERSGSLVYTDYSTSVVKRGNGAPPSLSSILTVRPNNPTPTNAAAGTSGDDKRKPISQSDFKTLTTDSNLTTTSFHTANDVPSSMYTQSAIGAPSIAVATIGGSSTVRSEIIGGLHRFTLIKLGATSGGKSALPTKRISIDSKGGKSQPPGFGAKSSPGVGAKSALSSSSSWSPFDFFFGSGFGFGSGGNKGAKCDLCAKRLGWKPCLECDDCGLR